MAELFGLSSSDLEKKESNALGGKAAVWLPREGPQFEVEIGGRWLSLQVLFAENTPPLLGRDVVFANFKIRMEDGETELRPR